MSADTTGKKKFATILPAPLDPKNTAVEANASRSHSGTSELPPKRQRRAGTGRFACDACRARKSAVCPKAISFSCRFLVGLPDQSGHGSFAGYGGLGEKVRCSRRLRGLGLETFFNHELEDVKRARVKGDKQKKKKHKKKKVTGKRERGKRREINQYKSWLV